VDCHLDHHQSVFQMKVDVKFDLKLTVGGG